MNEQIVSKPAAIWTRRKRLWLWLTSAEFRREREFVHPALLVWRCLWFLPILVLLTVYCVAICIAFGRKQAARTFGEGWE